MTSLLHTKKMFIDTYGEVPPMVAFLGIDTDGGWYNKELESKSGQIIKLDPSEQLQILVQTDPQDTYRVNEDRFSWFPKENLKYLKSMTLGAGQLRSNGRFAITYNEKSLSTKLKQVINQISNVTNSVNPDYDLLASSIEIHMVFSVCGGTGCGTFLNAAYLVREACPDCKLCGYAVLPDVFETMAQGASMAKVKPNAYGAIQDLDYLMHLDMGKDEISIDYLTRTVNTSKTPFNVVYFVDNKNSNNDVYQHVNDLSEMISLALITATGELSVATASVSDNVEKIIQNGNMNIDDKIAWAAGFGICELTYQGSELRKIFAKKMAQRLIERMLNSCEDANSIANAWIDVEKIRENNGQDQVIDYIAPKEAPIPLTGINTPTNAKPEIEGYLANVALPKPSEIEAKVEALEKRVAPKLEQLLIDKINQECGVDTAEKVILSIQQQINHCLGEMRNELEDFKKQMPLVESATDSAISDLANYMTKFFKTHRQEYIDAVMDAANNLATFKREAVRREAAITFYTWLNTTLSEKYAKITNIKNVLKGVYKKLGEEISGIQYRANGKSQTFCIDLAGTEANNISYSDDELIFTDFVKSVTLQNKLYDFDSLDSQKVEDYIYNYTNNLPSSKSYEAKTIDQMLKTLSPAELDRVINNAIVKSKPLLKYNFRGHVAVNPPEDFFYVGVADANDSVLTTNDLFKKHIVGQSQISFSSIGDTNRIIIYRQVGNIPAFAIESLPSYKLRYENESANCHWDVNMERRMEREDFSLLPKAALDDSLELWVKGFIFGKIKKEGSMYYFQSDSLGDILDDGWVELKEYRDDAFNAFKNYKVTIRKEFNEFFDSFQSVNGTEKMQEKVNDAKLNYYEKYSCIGIDKGMLKNKGYEGIKDLITKELMYVKKDL